MKIWFLVSENYLEIKDVLKFESLKSCKGKNTTFDWLVQR